MSARKALGAARVVTCDPSRATHGDALGVLEDGVVVIEDGVFVYVGPRADAPREDAVEALGDVVVTPGLVDAHTHACWVGSRHHEYAIRMAGGDYRDIAKAGGGILSSHRAVAAASEDALAEALSARLSRMAALGVTTVEVKSGYGLEAHHEEKQLRAIARASARSDLPRVVPTFLALHALPEPARVDEGSRAAYVAGAVALVEKVAREGLARFVDAYVDENAFRVEEARALGQAAKRAGLGVRLHVGQFADVGGAELCAELGALSADHLEHVSPEGARRLAEAKTCAVLLPTASFTLGQTPPPVKALRDAGVKLVVASDANPGTAPTESLPLAMAMAVRLYGLTPEETLIAATRSAAESLGEQARGVIRVGAKADLVAWDLPHERAIVQPWGVSRVGRALREGIRIA